jgi:hypothetical protein
MKISNNKTATVSAVRMKLNNIISRSENDIILNSGATAGLTTEAVKQARNRRNYLDTVFASIPVEPFTFPGDRLI